MKKLLLIGDAAVSTGFARLNHAYAAGFQRAGWDVSILGLNYHGDPHPFPWDIYPTRTITGGDLFGLTRLPDLVKKVRPDLCLLTNDPWNFAAYLRRIGNTPTIGSVAVDGLNCRGRELNGLLGAIFWTDFGAREAALGGYQGNGVVIPLGVDLDIYKPQDLLESRKAMGLPPSVHGAYIVGVVGRNQPRKRLDLAMIYFAKWIKEKRVEDAYLFLHVGPTGDQGYDLDQLGRHLGISNRIIMNAPEVGQGVSEKGMALTYSAFDCMLTTTQGEGWGLTHMEGMSCGVPQILPEWAALAEWAKGAASFVPCTTVACTPNNINVIGGVPDERATVEALHQMYVDVQFREDLSDAGLTLAAFPKYRWEDVGDRAARFADEMLTPTVEAVGEVMA